MSQVHHAPCVSMPSSCHFSCSHPPSSGNRSGDLHLAGENERRERPKRSDPSCTICNGTGPVDCRNCFGRGRINHVDLVVLPKGEWPQWCQICGGSGLDYCHRCHGTGEYREPKASTSLSIENELCLGGAARPVKIQQI